MHLLITNDFPPKVGGIQNYLWELWRRFENTDFAVVTTPYEGSEKFDAAQEFDIVRYDRFWLAPTRRAENFVKETIQKYQPKSLIIDPAFPLGILGPRFGLPYGLVIHGAEASIPAKLVPTRALIDKAIRSSELIVSASRWAEGTLSAHIQEGQKTIYIPPGVDTERFVPLDPNEKAAARKKFGLDQNVPIILSVSRLVARKGFDTLIEISAELVKRWPELQVVIAGQGREEKRLRSLSARIQAPVKFLGYVDDADLAELYGCVDIATMLCHDRWFGLEQEGFGIVFLEASASATPVIAGSSGGSAEAVVDNQTGFIVQTRQRERLLSAFEKLLSDSSLRADMALKGRAYAQEFSYDKLAKKLQRAIEELSLSS